MSTQGHEKEAVNVEGLKAALKSSGNKAIYNEAICSTAGGTAAKVTNTVPPSFSLVSGAKILVKFTYAITVANATLQVGTNAAKPIFYHGAALAANLVKAGTSLLLTYDGTNFNIVGDINTDTTYQVMGASGANHASGLVPDTPSEAGTTKFLREDGTWQEVNASPEVQLGGNTPSSESDIKLFVDESADDTVEVYTKAQAAGQFVATVNMNTEPTESTLTYTSTDGTTKNFKVGDEVRVPDAEADNGYTFYKLYALTTESNVTTATWDKLGAGGSEVQVNEVAVISLVSDVAAHQSDLIGATIVVTDDDTSETLLSTTWQGTPIELEVAVPTDYTVIVGNRGKFLTPSSQSYSSKTTRTRNIIFEYIYKDELIDLGLPSGTKWAKGNIISDGNGGYIVGNETDYGAYVSFGNVTPHFSSNGSAFEDGYNFDNNTYASTPGASITSSSYPNTGATYTANSGYDAARQLLGGEWRMPTATEFQELNNNCTSVWTTKNGVDGREFTSNINGAKIFFPATGIGVGTSPKNRGTYGYYYSSSLSSADIGYYLLFNSGSVNPLYNTHARYSGFTVRAVQ